jgi:hypothetical protein
MNRSFVAMSELFTQKNTVVFAALFLVLLAGPGCTTTKMNVDAQLVESEELAVRGRQGLLFRQRLRFGPYDTQNV